MKNSQTNKSLSCIVSTLLVCGLNLDCARAADDASPAPAPFNPFNVGIEVGTTGPGVSGSWRFLPHFGVRAGIDYLKYDHSGNIGDVNYTGSLRLASEPLTLDWYPSRTGSFHVSGGVAFNQNELSGTGSSSDTFTINGTQVNGPFNVTVKQLAASPYLSIGGNFFYFDRGHHFGFGGELGAMYTGRPRVSFNAPSATPGAQQMAVASEQGKIEHDARDFQVWPVLKLGLNFSF